MGDRIRVMMTTEGTYPFHAGGVSTWCDLLLHGKPESIDYLLYSVIMNPFVTQKFNLPQGTRLIKVPLWGTEEPGEHLEQPFSEVYSKKLKTTEKIVKDEFLPLFRDLVEEAFSAVKDPEKFGVTLHKMYRYFSTYEYRESFKSEIVWNYFKDFVFTYTSDPGNKISTPDAFSLVQSIGWLYRFFTVLNTPVPEVDVSHSVAAAFCGIPCVIAKLEYDAPFLLTEHGIYLREQYLSLSKRNYPPYLNTFLIRFVNSIVSLNYFYADQVSPVCNYNTRWERKLGVRPEKIKVIYNGVDEKIFVPSRSRPKKDYVSVVSVARIDPIKDIKTLMRAAALILKTNENVRFSVFGSVSVESYYKECLELKEELQLGDKFEFKGHSSDMASVYQDADIIALSSISEAFPYTVVEAMMTGKPVVTTGVGGVGEALGSCGVIVKPRDHEKLAEGLQKLIKDKALRDSMGADARERALNLFKVDASRRQYYSSYLALAERRKSRVLEKSAANITYIAAIAARRQALLRDKAYALFDLGLYEVAIPQIRRAIMADVNSYLVPEMLKKIAEAYCLLGDVSRAAVEIEKANLLRRAGGRGREYKLQKDKAYSLFALGMYEEAISLLRSLIMSAIDSEDVPFMLRKISEAYLKLGDPSRAAVEIEKANLLKRIRAAV